MFNEFRIGRAKYIAFAAIDLICLILANALALLLYLNGAMVSNYSVEDYWPIVLVIPVPTSLHR